MLFAVKTSPSSYARASAHVPDSLARFLEITFNVTPAEFLQLLEAYAVNGPKGVARSSRTIHENMKKECVDTLARSLRRVA